MTTDTQNGTALAVREFSDQQIRTRLKAAAEPGFGLDKATPAALNMVYLLARHYDVDPAVDITLFQGRPWFTIDGRVRLMRRHPQYKGYTTRPLSKDEKEAWGYKPGEIVVECTIRTKDWGEITARGKVTEAELTRNTPTGTHPQEMAEKRAIARASRMAFGQDVPDEDDAGFVLEERNAAETVAQNAARYREINGSDEDKDHSADVMVKTDKHPLWKSYVEAAAMAHDNGVQFDDVTLPVSEQALKAATQTLLEMLDKEDAAV